MSLIDWLGPQEWQAVRLSLWVAGVATLASLPLAVAVAWLLARRRFPGHGLVSGIVHLPLILPPVVTGYLLLVTFGTQGPVGSLLKPLGIVFAFRWTGAALACGIMAFPLMVRAIRLGFEAVDPKLEQAAATLGAPRPWIFLTVTLPLILPAIGIISILTFVGNFNAFDLIYVTQGALAGPNFATDILGTFLYRTFFGFQLQIGDPHMGATIATAMFGIILLGVCFYLFAIQTRLRRYQF